MIRDSAPKHDPSQVCGTAASPATQGATANRSATVETLRQRIARLEAGHPPRDRSPVSSTCPALDALLPAGGFRPGTLVEWLAGAEGSGAMEWALRTAGAAMREGGVLVVLDRRGEFYPPAAVQRGIDVERLIVVQASEEADYGWALDQVLRSSAVAAALAWAERMEGHAFRRLQLAAEEGGGLGLFIRPAAARQEPSWADVRVLVEPRPAGPAAERRWRLEILRCRGGLEGGSIDVELDDGSHLVPLVAQLAAPARLRRAAGM